MKVHSKRSLCTARHHVILIIFVIFASFFYFCSFSSFCSIFLIEIFLLFRLQFPHFLPSLSHATAVGNIMNEIIFIALLTSIIIIAFNLFALESNETFSVQALVGFFLMVCLLPLIFAICYFGETITTNLFDIGDIFYDSPWYRLPAEQQLLILLPIQRTGRYFRFKSMDLIECSLDTFSLVM